MIGGLWLIVSSVLLSACVTSGNSKLTDEQIMSSIHVGETTKQQVMNLLGEPEGQLAIDVAGSTREWWSYRYASAVINPIDYLLLYGLFYNGLGLYDSRYDVGVFFDYRGVVTSLSRTKTDYDMGAPFSSLRVSSTSNKTVGFSALAQKTAHFEDSMEYRY